MPAATAYAHIELRGEMPYIEGTQTKVVEVAMDRLAFNWDADEIHRQHPHLTLGQIYSALGYYYDHQAEMDRIIEDRARLADQILKSLPPSPGRAKLLAAKAARQSP
jgi:uncharacterized protein (DUF433 family)